MLLSAGESVDISDGDTESMALTGNQPIREKMVYMSVGDSHHHGNHSTSTTSMHYSLIQQTLDPKGLAVNTNA